MEHGVANDDRQRFAFVRAARVTLGALGALGVALAVSAAFVRAGPIPPLGLAGAGLAFAGLALGLGAHRGGAGAVEVCRAGLEVVGAGPGVRIGWGELVSVAEEGRGVRLVLRCGVELVLGALPRHGALRLVAAVRARLAMASPPSEVEADDARSEAPRFGALQMTRDGDGVSFAWHPRGALVASLGLALALLGVAIVLHAFGQPGGDAAGVVPAALFAGAALALLVGALLGSRVEEGLRVDRGGLASYRARAGGVPAVGARLPPCRVAAVVCRQARAGAHLSLRVTRSRPTLGDSDEGRPAADVALASGGLRLGEQLVLALRLAQELERRRGDAVDTPRSTAVVG